MTNLNTLPYGRGTIDSSVLEKLDPEVLTSGINDYHPGTTEEELVRRALSSPVGSPALRELAAGRRRVVILASDHTRPVPSKIIIPQLLAEIRAGNPEAEITLMIATGCHRGTSRAELEAKFGREIVAREQIVVHDCDCSEMVDLGVLPSADDPQPSGCGSGPAGGGGFHRAALLRRLFRGQKERSPRGGGPPHSPLQSQRAVY